MNLKKTYIMLRRRLRFYRHHSSNELMWGQVYFSQYGEDIFLREYFRGKQNGFYIDVGAYHPVEYSNTYHLYRNGWRGINIEPNPEKLALFSKVRPGDTTLSLAISDTEGTVTFAIKGELSGIVNHQFFHQGQLKDMRHIEVKTRPLHVVLAEHLPSGLSSIDVLSVDCEGHDRVVLGSNDWEAYRPLLVLCEAFDPEGARQLEEFLTRQSYRRLAACGPTLIFEDTRKRPDRPPSYH